MGEVYLAEDTRLHRNVALKLLPAEFTKDPERVRRFEQEARAASALNHPNIITIFEIGQLDDAHFIATEFVEGLTLRERLAQTALPLGEALDIAVQVAQALAAAHARGIIHRDIKPDNIMLRPDGYVKVLDFGLAKLTERETRRGGAQASHLPTAVKAQTEPGIIMGTVRYMSPEQARGQRVDARSDVFSLGIVIYEMLTGSHPFTGATMTDVMAAILRADPQPLTQCAKPIPPELDRLALKALRKDRDERYQTVRGLLTELKRVKQRFEFTSELERVTQSGELSALGDSPSSSPHLVAEQPTMILNSTGRAPSPRTATRRARIRKVIDSLAVLPLINASADASAEYLSDGITESIINSLSQLPKLRVVPRSTVFRYKGQDIDPQEVGEELGVRAVLTGRAVQLGDSLIIKTELIDVAHESQIWGEQYRRKVTDIFELQEEIANEISAKLRLKLTGEEKKRLTKRYTDNTVAYQLYLKGRYYNNRRTEDWIKKGIEHFQQAIELDPNYALAYAGLADAYAFLASSTGGWPPRESYPKAKAAAAKALAIDDTLAEAHTSMGFYYLLYEWDFVEAERAFKRAIELNPNYANAHDGYGFCLRAMGKHEQSIQEVLTSQQLDPLSLFTNVGLGWACYFARNFGQSVKHCEKALEMDAKFFFAYWNLGLSYLQMGKHREGVEALRKGVTDSGGNLAFYAHFGYGLAVAGNIKDAEDVIKDLEKLAARSYVSSYYFAIIHLGLGRDEEAFEWLELAFGERAGFLAFLNVEPIFDTLRADARFQDLLRRIGFSADAIRGATPA